MPRPKRTVLEKRPTWTHLVLNALSEADDFMTAQQLCEVTGGSVNQVTAALHHLKVKAHAVDCMESDDRLWWYITGVDRRTIIHELRMPEDSPRSRGRKAR
jgi:hypothetical protein